MRLPLLHRRGAAQPASLCSTGMEMPEERVWSIFTQICLALRYIHKEKQVVHRDLTPSNIMINVDGFVEDHTQCTILTTPHTCPLGARLTPCAPCAPQVSSSSRTSGWRGSGWAPTR